MNALHHSTTMSYVGAHAIRSSPHPSEDTMQQTLAVAALALMLAAPAAFAQQSPNTTPGTLSRSSADSRQARHTDQFWADSGSI